MTGALAEFLRGHDVPWPDLAIGAPDLVEFCAEEDLTGLVQKRLSEAAPLDWPTEIVQGLERRARADAALEMVRRHELAEVLGALAAAGVHPVLFKGTALAYQVYDSATLRPRNDTDLLIRRADEASARRVLESRGYAPPIYCDGELLFCQFELQKTDRFGVRHAFDFHWKISTQSMFADLLGFEEMSRDAEEVAALGPGARAAGLLHALLIACVHPVMHHRNAERLIWVYDVHLLASRLSPEDGGRFAALAESRQVAAICAHALQTARDRLGTPVPGAIVERLRVAGKVEASARYLEPGRLWKDELIANVGGLRSWRDRFTLLREVGFPSASYMLRSYGWRDTVSRRALLPLLYTHRAFRGIGRVLSGRK